MNILDVMKLIPHYSILIKIQYMYFENKWRIEESELIKIGDIPYRKLNNWSTEKIIDYITPCYDEKEGPYLLIALSDIEESKQ